MSVENQHLFILGMNDSGTTFLQNSLSLCANVVSFKHKKRPNGMEGQGVSFWKKKQKGWYPRDIDHGVVKIYSEKKEIWQGPGKFNWKEVKEAWNEAWKQNDHWRKANPRILLEKTPTAIFSVDMIEKQFPNAKFLIIHRNPYAICEGIRRTIKQKKKKNYSLERCAKHWVECSREQIANIEKLADKSIWFKYEDLVTKPGKITEQIQNFQEGLNDLDFRKPVVCHSMDKPQARGIQNYNIRHLRNLSPEDFTEINKVISQHMDVMNFFEYTIRTEAP